MASPQIIVFTIFDSSNNPLTGQAGLMSFTTYKNEIGTNLSAPTIVEVGGGAYKFTPTFATNHGIAWVINTGAGANPPSLFGYIRPEDFYPDQIQDLTDEAFGKWQIFTIGGNANKLILYRADGVTILKTFDLQDASGNPTTTNPFIRVPE